MARSESSKGASYMVRKERGLSKSCSAKCSVSTRKQLRRRILSLAEIDLNVTYFIVTSPMGLFRNNYFNY